MCLIVLLVGACNDDLSEDLISINTSDVDEPVGDWEALFADTPDPKTLPDELKADQDFPAQFDLVDLQSPVKSQGRRGVCSIFSTVALMEHLYIKQGAVSPDFSEQFLQWSVKAELGRFKTTGGSNGSANLTAINRYGIVLEDNAPYQSSPWSTAQDVRCSEDEDKQPIVCFTNGEPDELAMSSERFTLPPSRWVGSNRQNIKAFLTENEAGIVVGMTFFYQSWNHRKSKLRTNSQYSRQGYVLYPNEADKEKSLEKRAGHSILIVGWDDELEVAIRDEEGNQVLDDEGKPIMEKGFFLFKNSWGTSKFGQDNPHGPGYGWLSMKYVEEYGSAVSARPPSEDLTERCDDGLDNNFDGLTDCDDLSCAEAASCQVLPEPELNFSVSSEESVELPDQKETISILNVEANGLLEQLTIHLAIEHSFSGDLDIDLESPMGTRVNLIASDIEMNLNEINFTETLNAFRGERAAGEWKLIMTDRYPEDYGVLQEWSLSAVLLDPNTHEPQHFQSSPSLLIPDDKPEGIEAPLEVSAEGELQSVTAQVKITHSYRGDLIIRLIHPNGDAVTLLDREGRNEENVELDVAVPRFLGLNAQGVWKLHVSDLGAGDRGTIVEWGVVVSTNAE